MHLITWIKWVSKNTAKHLCEQLNTKEYDTAFNEYNVNLSFMHNYDFHIKRCSVPLYLQLFVGGLMFYLCNLCLFTYSGVQHILHWILFCFFFFMLPVSPDCPFLIAPLVFSNVYFRYENNEIHGKKMYDCIYQN